MLPSSAMYESENFEASISRARSLRPSRISFLEAKIEKSQAAIERTPLLPAAPPPIRIHARKAEIDEAKQRRIGGYQRGYQTVSGLAGYYSSPYFFDDSYIDYHTLPDRIKSVTKTQIVTAAKQLFEDDVWGLGVLGNPAPGEVATLTEQLRQLWK